jgi:hypothetical protein
LRDVALDPGEGLAARDRAVRLLVETGASGELSWLESLVLDRAQPLPLQDRAVRLMDQHGTTSAGFARLYDRVEAVAIRQRLIRILANRGDDVAVEKVMAIAERDPQPDVRRYALRRLSETKNVKARTFLEGRVLR